MINPLSYINDMASQLTSMNFANGAVKTPTEEEVKAFVTKNEYVEYGGVALMAWGFWGCCGYLLAINEPWAKSLAIINAFVSLVGYDIKKVSSNFQNFAEKIYQIKEGQRFTNSDNVEIARRLSSIADAQTFNSQVFKEVKNGVISQKVFQLLMAIKRY